MIFKLGFKQFKNHLLSNIFIILQMTVVFLLVIFMVSAILSRSKYYTPFKDVINQKGFFCDIDTGQIGNIEKLEGFKDIFVTYNTFILFDSEEEQEQSGNRSYFDIKAYDKNVLDRIKPTISRGKWITESESDEFIPAVIIENNYGFDVGDIIELPQEGKVWKIKITGVLADDSYIFGHYSGGGFEPKHDFRDLYSIFNHKYYGNPLCPIVFMKLEDIKSMDMEYYISGSSLITFNNISDETLKENRQILGKDNYLILGNETIKTNSEKYIYQQIYLILPIIICIMVITLVSSISVSAISAKKQLKNYAIYYICGSKWKECTLINLISSGISSFISICISVITIAITQSLGLLKETVLTFNLWHLLFILIILILYLGLSIIMPIRIIGKTTPKNVLYSK
ncbi:MAG: hypothetical protein GX896_07780 [Clostridiales bacterium]|nr:hypothetical protein [Clostridiales bacterium]